MLSRSNERGLPLLLLSDLWRSYYLIWRIAPFGILSFLIFWGFLSLRNRAFSHFFEVFKLHSLFIRRPLLLNYLISNSFAPSLIFFVRKDYGKSFLFLILHNPDLTDKHSLTAGFFILWQQLWLGLITKIFEYLRIPIAIAIL